jgi:hypothetical protein
VLARLRFYPSLARFRAARLAACLALLLFAAAFAGSAHAAVAALEGVRLSALSTSSNKGIGVSCPGGKRVTGAAGSIGVSGGGGGQVALRLIRPNDALTGVTVTAVEDQNGFAGFWDVTARAICATPPAGLERVAATSPSNSSNKSATATCPGNKRLLGTGAELTGGEGQVALNDIIPGSGLQSVSVQALEDSDGTTDNWSVTAVAVCANAGPGRERVAAGGVNDSSSPKSASAPCPVGKQLTGLGGEITGGGGQVVAHSLVPQDDLASGSFRAFEDESGTAASWSVRAFSICAPASERAVATTPSNSTAKADLVPCPAGKLVTGGGGEITGGAGQVPLTQIFPADSSLTSFLAVGEEDENGFAGNWFLRIYAICATPLPGLELVTLTADGGIGDADGLVVTTDPCPAGKRVVGLGAEVGGGGGEVVLKELEPVANLTSARVTAVEDESEFAGVWSLTAHAICATAPPGLELVSAATEPDSDTLGVTATCPAGKNLLGAGGEIEGIVAGQVVLDDVRPNPLLTSVTVTGLEDETGVAGNWFPRAYAICANA